MFCISYQLLYLTNKQVLFKLLSLFKNFNDKASNSVYILVANISNIHKSIPSYYNIPPKLSFLVRGNCNKIYDVCYYFKDNVLIHRCAIKIYCDFFNVTGSDVHIVLPFAFVI